MTLGLSEAPGIGRFLIDTRFTVPNHQRDYSWTLDEVRELLEDVTIALEENQEVYFVGLMVFLGSSQSSDLIVLDGQQRLATTVILLSAIRGWLRQYDEYREDADDIQRDYIGHRELGRNEITPKLTLNTANHHVFTDYIVKSVSLSDAETKLRTLKRRDRNRRLLEATIYLRRRIDEITAEKADRAAAAAYLFSLVEFIKYRVGVVKLLVPSDDMAYAMFETLNDRGLELSPLDLVKNHLFGRAAAHSPVRIKEMEDRWAQMMQTLSSVRSDNFLKSFWTSRHGRIRTRKLFDAFKRQYDTAERTNSLSVEMLEAAEQYAALENPDDPVWAHYDDRARKTVRALKVVGSQQAHPVVLAPLARFDPRETERLLRLLEVCVVRYILVVGGATGRFETRCAVLAGKIYAREVRTATDAFNELREVYPTDEQFRQAFEFKDEENDTKARYILTKLEEERQRIEGEQMGNELAPSELTVEHIRPKSAGRTWITELQDDPTLAEDCTYRFGNMCLLTSVNRKLGNKTFEQKKEFFEQSRLEMTKELAE